MKTCLHKVPAKAGLLHQPKMVRRWRPGPWLPTDLCDLEAEHDSYHQINYYGILMKYWFAQSSGWHPGTPGLYGLITAGGGKPCVFSSV